MGLFNGAIVWPSALAALSPFGSYARSAISAILRNVNTRRRFASGSFAISASVSAIVLPYAWYVGIVAVGWRRHRSFARKGCLDRWPQLCKLPRLTLNVVLSELRHDFCGKEFECFADIFVPVLPALLDKYRLVHAGILESAQRAAQFRGRADAYGAPAQHLSTELITHRQIAVPDVGATRRVLAEDIVMGQCELKGAKSIRASTPSLAGLSCGLAALTACSR